MDYLAPNAPSLKRLNVLTFDGGGIRGISSILILQDLMREINNHLSGAPGSQHRKVEPHEIFDLVAGTSTGGLIAIMLGKLGMSLEECVDEYDKLSTKIFSSKHRRAQLTFGLASARYSGSRLKRCVHELLVRKGFDKELPIIDSDNSTGVDKIACAVICREHQTESRDSDYKPDPVCICTRSCREAFACLVWQAARATSAAPTYFPIQKIHGRAFSDGGIEFNNPSFTIFQHYRQPIHVMESRRASIASHTELQAGTDGATTHGGLDFTRIRIVNLGTGTEPSVPQTSTSGFLASILPPLRMAAFLKRTLTKTATTSERVAGHMKLLATVSDTKVKYERFSEDAGLCYIELDKYKKLEEIKAMTRAYLATTQTQKELKRVAAEIARDYMEDRRPAQRPATLAVPGSIPVEGDAMSSPASTQSTRATTTQNGERVSGDSSAVDSSVSEPSNEAVGRPSTTSPIVVGRTSVDIAGPAESMMHSIEPQLLVNA